MHDAFIGIMTKIKDEREKGVADLRVSKHKFIIPFNLIAFMANEIEWWTQKTEQDILDYQLMPWKDLKRVIFDMYDHRLEHAAEINGLANTRYCAMNEYMLIYLLDVYKNRQTVEKVMFELLINLWYFYENQQRVRSLC